VPAFVKDDSIITLDYSTLPLEEINIILRKGILRLRGRHEICRFLVDAMTAWRKSFRGDVILIEQLAEARRNAHENCSHKKKAGATVHYLLFVEKRSGSRT